MLIDDLIPKVHLATVGSKHLSFRMMQNRGVIAGACIACLGIGYFVGDKRLSNAESAGSGAPTLNSHPPRSPSRDRLPRGSSPYEDLLSGILKGRPLADVSNIDLADLIVQLSDNEMNRDPLYLARKAYQLQLLLGKLPISRLEEVAETIASDPKSRRFGSLNTIASALAAKDPRRALAWAKEQKTAQQLPAYVIGAIANDDPFTAAEIYRIGLLNGEFRRYSGLVATSELGRAMAKLGKKPFIEFIDSLPLGQQGTVLSGAFRELPESEQSAAIDEVYSRYKDGRINDWSIKSIFNTTAASNPALAEAWLAKMEPGKDSASLALSTASFLSQTNPEASREWMTRAISRSQGSEKELLQIAIQEMSFMNPSDIATFASLLPAGVDIRSEDLKNSVNNSIGNNLSGLPEIVGVLHDPAEQAKLITGALNRVVSSARSNSPYGKMNPTDFEIFESGLKSLGLTGENAQKVRIALDRAKNVYPNVYPKRDK